MFLMYFWALNSNMFPEFLYHPHFHVASDYVKAQAYIAAFV